MTTVHFTRSALLCAAILIVGVTSGVAQVGDTDTTGYIDGLRVGLYGGLTTNFFRGTDTYSLDLRIWNVGIGIANARSNIVIPDHKSGDPPGAAYAVRTYDWGYFGVDLKYYQPIAADQLFIFVTGGYYTHRIVYLRQSTIDGTLYEGGTIESTEPDRFAYGLGISVDLWDIHSAGLTIGWGMEFHSMRGFGANIGLTGLL